MRGNREERNRDIRIVRYDPQEERRYSVDFKHEGCSEKEIVSKKREYLTAIDSEKITNPLMDPQQEGIPLPPLPTKMKSKHCNKPGRSKPFTRKLAQCQ